MSFNIKNIFSGPNVRMIAIVAGAALVVIPLIKKIKGRF